MPDKISFIIPPEQKSLDQWVFDTITPVVITIDKIMEQLLFVFMEVYDHVD